MEKKNIKMYTWNKNNSKYISYSTVCDRLIKNIMSNTIEIGASRRLDIHSMNIFTKYGKVDVINITKVGDDDYMVCATNSSIECTASSLKRAITEIVENVVNEFFNETSETNVENETTETAETLVITDENETNYSLDDMNNTINDIINNNVINGYKKFNIYGINTKTNINIIVNECMIILRLYDDYTIIDKVQYSSIEYIKTLECWLKYIE